MKYRIRREPTLHQGLMWVCRLGNVVQCAFKSADDMLTCWAEWDTGYEDL